MATSCCVPPPSSTNGRSVPRYTKRRRPGGSPGRHAPVTGSRGRNMGQAYVGRGSAPVLCSAVADRLDLVDDVGERRRAGDRVERRRGAAVHREGRLEADRDGHEVGAAVAVRVPDLAPRRPRLAQPGGDGGCAVAEVPGDGAEGDLDRDGRAAERCLVTDRTAVVALDPEVGRDAGDRATFGTDVDRRE